VIAVEEGALERLEAHVRRPALVVMDANTEAVAGSRVARALGAETLVLPADLHATEDAAAAVRARVRGGLVAVGSGTLTDVVRYAAHTAGCDFVSVPTAASMDGYSSSVAALERDGVKLTLPARAPVAILADPRIAAAAPVELTRAGVGDLLAKATARVDWLAAHLLYGEAWQELPPPPALDVPALLAGEVDAVALLLRALIDSGLAMAAIGSSRPASGCEHHASHLWDLLAGRGIRPRALHGLQVGYATGFAMRLQRFAFAGERRPPRRPEPVADPLGDAAREWIGDPPPDVVAAVAEKQRLIAATPASWPGTERRWAEVCARLEPALRRFQDTGAALCEAGIPDHDAGYLGIDAAMLRAGLRFGGRLRARYTVVDFLEGQGVVEEALDAALAPATSANGRARG
jgi:glycerol-1-phosphate dehydrogenase [NAD(P)+]